MKSYDQSIEINHNPNQPYIPDRGLGSRKTNVLLKFYRILIKFIYTLKIYSNQRIKYFVGRESVEIEHLKSPKAFIDYSQAVDDVYKNLEDQNQTKKRGVLNMMILELVDMIADMESNKKLSPIVTELFLRGRKLNVSLV